MPMTPLTGLDRTSPTFKTDLDTFFISSLPAFVTEANALETSVDADRVAAAASAAAALVSKDAAVASQVDAGLSQVAAAASAASAINAPGTSATSTTSLTVGAGSKTLAIQTGKLFSVGQTLVIASTSSPANQMVGVITAHDNTTGSLTINSTKIAGVGTFSAWTVALGIDGVGLPNQPGNAGKVLGTDGTSAAWVNILFPDFLLTSQGII